MTVDRELHGLIDQLIDGEPRAALSAYRRLSADQMPWLERRAVLAARRQGLGWADIGRLLGRSRQAVLQRFGGAFRIDELTAPAPAERHGDAARRDLDGSIDRARRQMRLQQMEDDDAVVPW